jgi:hypothetical protein
VELDTARSKLTEVEHHEWALTSKYEDLKKDLESKRTAHDAVVKEKGEVQKTSARSCSGFRILFVRGWPSFSAILRPRWLCSVEGV